MDELLSAIERDANVAVLEAIVGLTALPRPLSWETVLRDASRRLLQAKGPTVSHNQVQNCVQAAIERVHIGGNALSDLQAARARLHRYWA
jgi:hypothetical protein